MQSTVHAQFTNVLLNNKKTASFYQ